jgi:hypothetical protein
MTTILRKAAPGKSHGLALLTILVALPGPAVSAQQAEAEHRAPSIPAAHGAVRTVAPVIVKGKARHRTRTVRKPSPVKKSLPSSEFRKATPSGALGRYAASHSDPNAATGQQREMMERAQGPAAGSDPDSGLGPR